MNQKLLLVAIVLSLPSFARADGPLAWKRHTIDASSRGADGVRLRDINGDGRLDIATGWEEGGRIRVCLHPGKSAAVRSPWPSVTVGQVRSPEDAVFADLDGDGAVDVVSCCEGRQRRMFVHWSLQREALLKPQSWQTETFTPAGSRLWMFCLPMQVDGGRGVDLVVGAKGKNAAVGWLESPENPRDIAKWKWHEVVKAGWIMSLAADDVDGDGELDLIFTDRKGSSRGCYWAKRVMNKKTAEVNWTVRPIGGQDREVMFMTIGDLDGDRRQDILTAVRGMGLLWLRRTSDDTPSWKSIEIPLPPDTGTGKGVAIGDLDQDGTAEIVFTCENAKSKHGVMWLSPQGKVNGETKWTAHPISGSGTGSGVKFDRVELHDLDNDGDLDVLTCEERDNLGVIWYENPTR